MLDGFVWNGNGCGVAHWAGVYGVLESLSTNASRGLGPAPPHRALQEVPAIEVLRVSGHSRPNSVAGAIAALLRNEGEVEVQAIGPQAVNQAAKAIAITRSYVEGDGLDLTAVPSFVKLELQNEERTALRFHVRAVPTHASSASQQA